MPEEVALVQIPDDMDFSDLKLKRSDDGTVSFNWIVIERICCFNELPTRLFLSDLEENAARLIFGWYRLHIRQGGAPDPVVEELVPEAFVQQGESQRFSHSAFGL